MQASKMTPFEKYFVSVFFLGTNIHFHRQYLFHAMIVEANGDAKVKVRTREYKTGPETSRKTMRVSVHRAGATFFDYTYEVK